VNYVEISDLLSKGFTPDQIMLLVSAAGGNSGENPGGTPEHSEEQPEDPGQDHGGTPEHSEEQQPEHTDAETHDPAVDALREEIKSLKETLQKQNIINQRFEQPPETADAEKVLAGIIRPPFEEADKK